MRNENQVYQSILSKRLMMLRLLAGAMGASVIVYIIIGWFMSLQAEAAPPPDNHLVFRIPLLIAGIVIGLGSIGVRIVLCSKERLRHRLAQTPNIEHIARASKTDQIDAALLENLKSLTEPEQKIIGLIAWYMTPYILMLALSEAVALLGLVLAILTKNPFEMLPFAVVSLFLMIRTALHPGNFVARAESMLRHPLY